MGGEQPSLGVCVMFDKVYLLHSRVECGSGRGRGVVVRIFAAGLVN